MFDFSLSFNCHLFFNKVTKVLVEDSKKQDLYLWFVPDFLQYFL